MFRNFFAIRRSTLKKKNRRAAADTNVISFPQKFHARLNEIFKFHKMPPHIAEKLLANIDDSAKTRSEERL